MSFARPPAYTGRVKPKKKTQMTTRQPPSYRVGGISAVGSRAPTPRSATAASAVPPGVTAPQPVAPLTPPPLPAPKAPPMNPGAANDRISATEQYGSTLADTNEQLRELALQYGGVGSVQQFGQQFDPTTNQVTDTTSQAAVTQNDPLSALATLERQYLTNQRGIGENANAQNTFFSGLQLRDQQQNTDDRARGITAAQRDYESKVAQLTRLLLQAQGARRESFRNADLADLLAAPPAEAQADQAPVEAPVAAEEVPVAAPSTPSRRPLGAFGASPPKKKKPKKKGKK
jgi:hypothetical protein